MAVPEGVGLGELITRTAEEIRNARNNAPKNDPVLLLSGCELTLAVTVSAEVGGGLKVHLFNVSAKGKGERASTIKLTFGPAGTIPASFAVFGSPSDEPDRPVVGGTRASVEKKPDNKADSQ